MFDKSKRVMAVTVILLGLGGCVGPMGEPAPASASSVNSDPNFQLGYRDGCATAHGEYTKDSQRFNADKNYYDGWFAGRSACQYK